MSSRGAAGGPRLGAACGALQGPPGGRREKEVVRPWRQLTSAVPVRSTATSLPPTDAGPAMRRGSLHSAAPAGRMAVSTRRLAPAPRVHAATSAPFGASTTPPRLMPRAPTVSTGLQRPVAAGRRVMRSRRSATQWTRTLPAPSIAIDAGHLTPAGRFSAGSQGPPNQRRAAWARGALT